MTRKPGVFILILITLCSWVPAGSTQELTPRAYWPAPKGTQVLTLGYIHTSGDIVPDPSLPISGVDSEIDTLVLDLRGLAVNWAQLGELYEAIDVMRYKPGHLGGSAFHKSMMAQNWIKWLDPRSIELARSHPSGRTIPHVLVIF